MRSRSRPPRFVTIRRLTIRLLATVMLCAVAVAVVLLRAAAPDDDPFAAAAVVEQPLPSLTYGIQTFLWWDDGYTGLTLDLVHMMGFNHIKQIFAWRDIEPAPDDWHFYNPDRFMADAEARDIAVVARLGFPPDWALQQPVAGVSDTPPADLTQWATYCGRVASQYRGRISAYQVWNEPNLAREWGNQPPDPAAYVDLLASCSRAIRAADPAALIVSAGMAPTGTMDDTAMRDDIFLDRMYDAGFQQYVDLVGVHAPGFAAPSYGPDDAERDGRGRWASFRRVEDLRRIMVAHGDAARQMAILEMGWTTDTVHPEYAWYAVSEQQQADYLVEAFDYMIEHWRPWVGLVSLIYMPDSQWTPDDEAWWWAIIEPPRVNRPAFGQLFGMRKVCDDVVIPAKPDTPASEAVYRELIDACPLP